MARKKKKGIHSYYKPGPIKIALEEVPDVEFFWTEKQIENFKILWNLEMPFKEIARQLKKSETSVFLIVFDQVMAGEIKGRKGWTIW